MPAVLSTQGDPEAGPVTYGSECPEHPERDREGLALQHAMNTVAKHNREQHAEPVLNLSAAARAVQRAVADAEQRRASNPATNRVPEESQGVVYARHVWAAMTGLPAQEAVPYLDAVLAEPEDVLLHVAPF